MTKKKLNENKAELQEQILIATSVVLLELALVEGSETKLESSTIISGLCRIFGISLEKAQEVTAQARNILNSLRGSSSYAEFLCEAVDLQTRIEIFKLIDDVNAADGSSQGFESYLRERFRVALGIGLASKT